MRILFLESDPIWISGLPNGFCDIGHEVIVSGPVTLTNVPYYISSFNPDLIITLGWTSENSEDKLSFIHQHVIKTKIPLVYWATEDPTHTSSFTLPLIKKLQPDFVFTICPSMVNYYKQLGIKAAHMDFGYHEGINHYVPPQDKYRCEIAVVANGYSNILKQYPNHFRIKSIETLICPLIKNDIPIDFWGWGWEDMGQIIKSNIPPEWIHGKVPYEDTSKIYSSANIVIGIQNHTTQLTQRTYEILASRGFLLTSDTMAIRNVFEPNKDLVVSSSPEETLNLIQDYRTNSNKRDMIKIQGEASVKKHSYANRAEYMINVLQDNNIIIKL